MSLSQTNTNKELLEEQGRLIKQCELIAEGSGMTAEEVQKTAERFAAERGITTAMAISEIGQKLGKAWGSEPLYTEKKKKNYEKCGCASEVGQMLVYVTPNCPNGHRVGGRLAMMIKTCRKCTSFRKKGTGWIT